MWMTSRGFAGRGGRVRAFGEPAGLIAVTVVAAVTGVAATTWVTCAETANEVHSSLGVVGDRVRRSSTTVVGGVRIQRCRSSDEPGAKR